MKDKVKSVCARLSVCVCVSGCVLTMKNIERGEREVFIGCPSCNHAPYPLNCIFWQVWPHKHTPASIRTHRMGSPGLGIAAVQRLAVWYCMKVCCDCSCSTASAHLSLSSSCFTLSLPLSISLRRFLSLFSLFFRLLHPVSLLPLSCSLSGSL